MDRSNSPLEQLYLDLLAQHGLANLEHEPEKIKASLRAMENGGWSEGLSMFGDPLVEPGKFYNHYDPVLKTIKQQVEKDVKLRGGVLSSDVFVGGFPIGEANACVKKTPHGYLVLVNFGLLQLLYQVGKIFALGLDSIFIKLNDGSMSAAARLGMEPCNWTKERSIEALAEVYRSYIRDGTVTTAPRHQLPLGSRSLFLANLVNYAEQFVIAHEYSHILLGHCDGPVMQMVTPVGEITCVENQGDELRADQLATSLMLASADWSSDKDQHGTQDVNLRVAGVLLLFSCNLIAEIIRRGPEGVGMDANTLDTHPTPNRRSMGVLKYLRDKYGASITMFGTTLLTWTFDIAFPVVGHVTDNEELKNLTWGVTMTDEG